MGEVYRARDTRLGREVAIKVLPEAFAADAERLRRFEREAKSLAALNHPNIAQIHGIDQTEDTCFLVLERVPGATLAERLERGALSIEEALDICRQIAEGLEAAHEAGVIHRDLKPAKRARHAGRQGQAARLRAGEAGARREPPEVHHLQRAGDRGGRLLGTPTYMAPEQARGKPIDRRVDVWAFGCLLYECLTGKRAFEGETLTDVLASVLDRDPDLSRLPTNTPPRVREVLARSFAKDPRTRLRDVGEARVALEAGQDAGESSRPPSTRRSSIRTSTLFMVHPCRRRFLERAGAGAAEISGFVAWWLWRTMCRLRNSSGRR